MVAWASFTAQNLDRGFLQFYSTGQAAIVYDKPILNSGVASAASSTKECKQHIDLTYSAATTVLDISIDLCDEGPCDANPCPDILSPQGMGYDPFNSQENFMEVSLNMQAVSTALAVNMGMIQLNHLVMVPGDNDRINLLSQMVDQGLLNQSTVDHTTSYYGE